MDEISKVEQGIAVLEAQRQTLGDEVVEASLAPLRARLAELQAAASIAEREQRKLVTVLFADISGFTAMSEAMDAEDVGEIMNALWRQVDKAIIDHNGLIDKHIGDAVMALWGTDNAREDDPEQAIRAALAMQVATQTFADERGIPLKMRIGVNTGLALLGEVGSTAEFTAIGDAVNTASRLEHAAPVGGILISHDTYRHVRGIFDVTSKDPIAVKGKAEPLQVYVVRQVKSRAFRMETRGVEGIETRTIGRDNELQQLHAAYQMATSQPQTTVVTLMGEAGVGKSRVMYEFSNWLELRPETIWYFKGRATQQTRGIPQYLLRDLLANRFQILDSDPLATVREKLVEGMTAFLPDGGEMKAHILGAWLGYDFRESPHLRPIRDEPEQIKNRATLYLAQLFTAIGKQGPAVVLLDDIHWADSGSLDALADLVRRRPRLPLLILCLTRPSLLERRPEWGAMLPAHTRLDLTPLSSENIRALVAEILRLIDPLPPLLPELVSGRAEGNPFYAEELVKMLIDDGVILTGVEAWKVAPEHLLELKVPPTLTAVLQARLDRLQPQEKQVLQQAAVIGRIFWDQALAALQAKGLQALPTLQAKEFIFLQPESAFDGMAEYIFKHALLRDATYETVLKRVRGQYHALVADWLAATAEANERGDEYAALIGEHYRLAGKLGLAATWYRRAGQQAAATHAHEEAVDYLSLALELTPKDEVTTRFALLETREKANDMLGSREAQREDLVQLLALVDELGEEEQARVALRQAHYSNAISQYTQAISHCQAAIELGERTGNWKVVAEGYRKSGWALYRQGDYSPAQEQFQLGLEIAQDVHDKKEVAYCLNGLGSLVHNKGDAASAREYFEQVLTILRETGDRSGEAGSLINLGIIAFEQNDYAAAKRYYERSLATSREVGDRVTEGACLQNLGFTAWNLGDDTTANKYYEQGLAISCETGDRSGEGITLINLGHLANYQGRVDEAERFYQKALAIHHEIGDRWGEGISLNELGAMALARADLTLSERYYQDAQIIRQELELPCFLAEDWAGLAQLKLAQGDLADARRFVEQILDYFKESPGLEGAENPMRAFRFTWEVLVALGLMEAADHVLALAAQVIQEHLHRNSDPILKRMYLSQPNHAVLWEAWMGKEVG